jgi:EpsI family protein
MATNSKIPLTKTWIVLIILLCTVVISYSVPRATYVGTDIISRINVPLTINTWQGKDVSDQLKLDITIDTNKFISEAKIIKYVNDQGDKLDFIILDAGNFHHPNVCFTAAGYKIEELDDTEFTLGNRTIRAKTLYTEKNQESSVSLYWIVIDKKITYHWIEQKMKQLYFSMFNRKRIGLMVRFDVRTDKDHIDNAVSTAKHFITELNHELSPEKAEYLFGKN